MIRRLLRSQQSALAVSAVLGLSLLSCDPPPPPSSLAEALEDYRPFPLRLTGGLAYGPCPEEEPPRCARVPDRVLQATRYLDQQRRVQDRTGPTRGLGILGSSSTDGTDAGAHRLVTYASPQKLRQVVADMELAINQDPQNADLHNNLAVAYAAQSAEADRHYGSLRFQAYAAAAEAVHLDPNHPEALFNLALLQGELGLRRRAAATWDRFLEIETDPDWRNEAAEHRSQLSAPREIDEWREEDLEAAAETANAEEIRRLVQLSPISTRTHLQRVLFPAWGEAYLAGELTTAEAAQEKLEAIIPILTEEVQDWEAADNLELIKAPSPDPEAERRRRALAAGVLELRELEFLPDGCPQERRRSLEQSIELLQEAGGGSWAWLAWGLGVCAHLEYDFEAALAEIEPALLQLDSARYPLAAGILYRQQGFDRHLLDDYWGARSSYLASISILERAREPFSLSSVRMLFVSLLQDLGLETSAWNDRYQLFDDLRNQRPGHTTTSLLTETARFLAKGGHLVAALQLQDEAIHLQDSEQDLPILAAFHRSRAAMRHQAGDTDGALEDLARARDLNARSEEDPAGKEGLLLYLTAIEGQVLQDRDPIRALLRLDEAIEGLRIQTNPDRLVEALTHRANLHRRSGDSPAAERDLREAIALLEEAYRTLEGDQERRGFLPKLGLTYRSLIALLSPSASPVQTLDLADRAAGGSLLQLPDHPLEDRLGALPADTAIVQYLSLKDTTLCWLLLPQEAPHLITLELGEAEAIDLLRRAVASLASRPATTAPEEILQRLGRRLLQPLLPKLKAVENLLFVADGPLRSVPFGALLQPDSGRYLMEDYRVLRAPSISTALALTERRERRGSWRPQRPLIVGDPSFAAHDFPQLRPLPGARREAERVSGLYPGATRLLGEEATAAAFRRLLPSHDLLQFGGHALPTPAPALLLTPDETNPSGAVTASDLAREMPDLRLAILSACGTAGQTSLLDLDSLVWPFLVAGADGVVATLWDVPDGPTGELMFRMHEYLAQGVDPPLALAKAQRSMIDDPNPAFRDPGGWGAFGFFGAF